MILSDAGSVFRSMVRGMVSRTAAAAKQRSRPGWLPQKNVSAEITGLLPRIGRRGKRAQDMAGRHRSPHPPEHVSTMQIIFNQQFTKSHVKRKNSPPYRFIEQKPLLTRFANTKVLTNGKRQSQRRYSHFRRSPPTLVSSHTWLPSQIALPRRTTPGNIQAR